MIVDMNDMDKRYLLDGALLNESDPFSTSAYPPQGNKASVTPADDCFDKETGAYILGCKVGRSENSVDGMVKKDEFVPTDVEDSSTSPLELPDCPPRNPDCKLNPASLSANTTFVSPGLLHNGTRLCTMPNDRMDGLPLVWILTCSLDASIPAPNTLSPPAKATLATTVSRASTPYGTPTNDDLIPPAGPILIPRGPSSWLVSSHPPLHHTLLTMPQ